MCPPALVGAAGALGSLSASTMMAVSLGVAAVQGVVGYVGQVQAAQAQADATSANLKATRDAAAADLVHKTADLNVRERQERAAATLRIDDARKTSAQASATARASSESAGLSFDALLADYETQYLGYADAQLAQLGWTSDQIERTKEGLKSQAEGRVNSVPRPPIQTPNLLGAITGVVGAGLNAYDRFTIRDPITGQRTL